MSVPGKLAAGPDAKLAVDLREVVLDGLDADIQAGRDFLVCQSRGYQASDHAFSLGEHRRRGGTIDGVPARGEIRGAASPEGDGAGFDEAGARTVKHDRPFGSRAEAAEQPSVAML